MLITERQNTKHQTTMSMCTFLPSVLRRNMGKSKIQVFGFVCDRFFMSETRRTCPLASNVSSKWKRRLFYKIHAVAHLGQRMAANANTAKMNKNKMNERRLGKGKLKIDGREACCAIIRLISMLNWMMNVDHLCTRQLFNASLLVVAKFWQTSETTNWTHILIREHPIFICVCVCQQWRGSSIKSN